MKALPRLAALYDIHGNLPALEAVLADMRSRGLTSLVVGGDVVPGPMPGECLDLLMSWPDVAFIHGNGDSEVVARHRKEETHWYSSAPETWRVPVDDSAGRLTSEQIAEMAAWPATLEVSCGPMGKVVFCHGTLISDTDCVTQATPESLFAPRFAGTDAAVIVCGHTHMQFDRTIGRTRVVNAGSVGMPFGEAGAFWLEIGDEIRLHRTEYDLPAAAKRVLATDYPQRDEFAASIRRPPSRDAMIAAFESKVGSDS